MKRIFSLFLAVVMLAAVFSSFSVHAEESVTILSSDSVRKTFNLCKNSVTASYTASNGKTMPYRLFVPNDYDPDKSYPIVLFLHGAGERGTDNEHIFGGPSIYKRLLTSTDRKQFPCLILAPQCPADSQWVLSDWGPGMYDHSKINISPYLLAAEELLDKVIDEYSVDQSAVYVSGVSMGGFGTWDLISRNRGKYAAAIPVCGGTDESYLDGLKGFPIRTFHAADDSIVNCVGTRKAAEILTGHGDFTYTEYSTGNHYIWDRAYATAGLTEWLFAQKREFTPTVTADENVTPTFDSTPRKAVGELTVEYTVKPGFKVSSVRYKGKEITFENGKFTVPNYMGGEVKVTATAQGVTVTGFKGYVTKDRVDLYFVLDDTALAKEIEVTFDGTANTVMCDDVVVPVAFDRLNEKITLKYQGKTVLEYTLKQYLEAVLTLESAAENEKAVASALLEGKNHTEYLK